MQINPDDGFPMLICLNCLNCLIDFQLFRSTCLSSATILEHLKEAAKLDDNPVSLLKSFLVTKLIIFFILK